VNRDELIEALGQSQALLLALVEGVDDSTCRTQYHPDLSPLGWHLGHCVYTECLWLHEKVRNDNSVTAPIEDFYTPPRTPKAERGARLPKQADLLLWAQELQAFNLHYLRNLRPEWRTHALFDDDYLIHFLIQHNSQHYETMLMILTQKSLGDPRPDETARLQALGPAALRRDSIDIPAGHYRIGGERPTAYDNELPRQQADLGPFAISRHPVSNAEYLAFIEAGGYRDAGLWDAAGSAWLQSSGVAHPDHWRQTAAGGWYALGIHGACELAAGEPVSGISHHEASAFARWAGGRLPHEYQWEAACRIGALEHTGRVWEWCANTFQPYDGFTPFPYEEYSQPWFDNRHFSLKGGSLHTRPAIRRPSFRNFFEADKRHVFAGLRLVY
jgi:iron(II)-dependent oxidoreductase